jgi:peptidoglycan/LPS O-acetylase OafA/YrhL
MSRRRGAPRGHVEHRGAKLGYRPALDGVRALAVAAVMLYHGGVSWASGGFLGVDVFFVLSGYLITSLLVLEWTTHGRIRIGAFWLRRARRLLPAMFAVLVAVAAYAFLASDDQQPNLRGDSLATLAYVSNWWFIASGQSYFGQFVEPSLLRHTWSLAIEEQYYIVFPILLVAWLSRARLGLASLRGLLLLGMIGSAVLMAALHDPLADTSRAYYGTDTRAQALLLGAVLALTPSLTRNGTPLYVQLPGRLVRLPGAGVLGWLALAGLLVMFATARELAPWMYDGGFLLAAGLSGVLIASLLRAPRSALGRVLSWRPVVAVGVVSYGLYLWHWPVYVVLDHERTGLGGAALLAVRVAVTGALAVLSHKLIEEPILTQRLQGRFTPTQWHRVVAAVTAGVVAVSLGATAAATSAGPVGASESGGPRPPVEPDARGRIAKVFLLGDSQAYGLRVLYRNQVRGLEVSGSTQLGCGTLLPERHVDGQTVPNLEACSDWEPRWVREIGEGTPDLVVMMLGIGELYDRLVDGEVVRFGTPDYRLWLFDEIDRRRTVATTAGSRFALTTVLCMRVSADAADVNGQLANDPDRLDWLNDTIRDYGTDNGVDVVDLHGTVCANGYRERVDGVELRDDGLHLNQGGADLVWGQLGPLLVRASRGS